MQVTEAATPSVIQPSDRWLILSALFALYIIWGSTYFAIWFVVVDIPPFMAGAVRFLIAGSVLFAVLKARGAASPTRAEWFDSAKVGALLMGGGMGCVMMAQHLGVASSLTAIFPAATPLLVSLFSGLWGQWPRHTEWLGLLVGFAGVVLLSLEGSLRLHLSGTLVLAIAPLAWSFGTAWSRHLILPKGLMASATEMFTGGVVLLLLSLLFGERLTHVPSWSSIAALVYLITFGSLIAYSSFVYLVGRVRPALATSYAYVNPVIAVLLGIGLGNEHLSVFALVALPVILLGVALVAMARK
jgi:drug/metabolite transporter (DMT)-like permease